MILTISIIIILIAGYITLKKIVSSDKEIKQKEKEITDYYKLLENLPSEDVIFNVDTFNEWFCDKDNNAVYANKGIFLRLDKFDEGQIVDYLEKRWGIKNSGAFLWSKPTNEMIYIFYKEIRKDWLKRINN